MVLYHSVSFFQLLEVILHRQKYHKDEKAVLVLPDFITDKLPEYEKTVRNGLFDEVYLFPYLHIPHISRTVERTTLRSYDELIPYPIESFDKIYIAGCHFYFSLVPIKRKVQFTVFEDSPGMIHNRNFLSAPLKKQFPVHAKKADRYGLFSFDNKYIERVIVNSRDDSVSKPQSVFSVRDALGECQGGFIDRICDVFEAERINTANDAVILLTEQFANLGMMSADEQLRLYRFVCDNYVNGKKLIIKPHPDDKTDYEKEIGNCHVIKQVFPSELMPYILSPVPSEMITVSSTAVLGFEGMCRTTVLSEDKNFIGKLGELGIPTDHLIRHIG